MSTITAMGSINYADPIRTRTEPASPIVTDTIAGGQTSQIDVHGFKNTGNVPQVCSVLIANVQGMTLLDYGFATPSGQLQKTFTLNPGFAAVLKVNVQVPDLVQEDGPYSFDITTNWQ